MQLLYLVTKGTEDATLASVPLHIAANGALEVGQEVSVVLVGDATNLVIGDNARSTEGVGVPPLRELLDKLREHRVSVYVRAAPSPVGRPRRAWRRSGACGPPHPMWRGSAPRPTGCSPSRDEKSRGSRKPQRVRPETHAGSLPLRGAGFDR